MTPEQLNLLYSMLAQAGSAIGGPGSAGDLIGNAVQQGVTYNRQQASIIGQEDRKAARDKVGAESALKIINSLGPGAGQNQQVGSGLSAGPGAGQGNAVSAQDYSSFGGVTPAGTPGITSLKADNNGGLNIAVDGLSAGELTNVIAAGLNVKNNKLNQELKTAQLDNLRATTPTPLDIKAREVLNKASIAQNELETVNGRQVTSKTATELTRKPEPIRVLEHIRDDSTLLDTKTKLNEASATQINLPGTLERAEQLPGATDRGKVGTSDHYNNIVKRIDDSTVGKGLNDTIAYGKTPEVIAEAKSQRATLINESILKDFQTAFKDAQVGWSMVDGQLRVTVRRKGKPDEYFNRMEMP